MPNVNHVVPHLGQIGCQLGSNVQAEPLAIVPNMRQDSVMTESEWDLTAYVERALGRRVTVEEMLEATGLTRSTFYRRKNRRYDYQDVVSAAEYFGLDRDAAVDELLGLKGDARKQDGTVHALRATTETAAADSDEKWPPAVSEWLNALAPLIASLPDRSRAAIMTRVVTELAIEAGARPIRSASEAFEAQLADRAEKAATKDEPPTYDPTYKPDFSEYDAASHGEKQVIPENGLESP